MSSIRQVAKTAGVSIATVSRVINGNETVSADMKNQVLAAIDRCEYYPAVGRRICSAIALIYAGSITPGTPHDSACFEGMVNAMRKSKYDLIVIDLLRDKHAGETFQQFFARKGICGAIVRSAATEREVLDRLSQKPFPLVVLGNHFEQLQLPSVYANSRDASREAVEHLISLAHSRVAFAASDRNDGDLRNRYDAYCEVMQEADLFDDEFLYQMPPHRMDGAQLLRKMMSLPDPPTAVFAADPSIASGLVNEAHCLGLRIPDELSLVGFDDTNTRNVLNPRMTAVCQDSYQLGNVAFECVVQISQGARPCVKTDLVQNAWLEINATTAPPPTKRFRILTSGLRLPAIQNRL